MTDKRTTTVLPAEGATITINGITYTAEAPHYAADVGKLMRWRGGLKGGTIEQHRAPLGDRPFLAANRYFRTLEDAGVFAQDRARRKYEDALALVARWEAPDAPPASA